MDRSFPEPWSVVPPDRTAVLSNWRKPPQNRWALRNARKLLTTEITDRRSDSFLALEESPRDLSGVTFPSDSEPTTLTEFLAWSHTDGFLVLHRGKVAFDYYERATGQSWARLVRILSGSLWGPSIPPT